MNDLRRFFISYAVIATAFFFVSVAARAQGALPGESAQMLAGVRQQIEIGRSQLNGNDATAVATLRAAAKKSLDDLVKYVGPQVLDATPDQMPAAGFNAAAAHQTAVAHYWWGRAADHFGKRDEAITAFARAAHFAGKLRPNAADTLARDSLLALGGALRDGLPHLAPDDTLEGVASLAHGGLWKPSRFDFGGQEFLYTQGRVYPPVPSSTVDVSKALSRVAPLYRGIAPDALPQVLRLDRLVIGYARLQSGEDAGLWREAVRVFYPSTYITHGQRDDSDLAYDVATQFLKVRSLFKNKLGAQNLYAKDGVTTIWLSEVSALWPRDEADPLIRAQMAVAMPKINTPTEKNLDPKAPRRPVEIEIEPYSYPWRVSDKVDSVSGDMMLFKLPEKRSQSEWLRELMHEYGHVALPAIDGFLPPLEPYANGDLGETLGMMWLAQSSDDWTGLNKDEDSRTTDQIQSAALGNVDKGALPALNFWKSHGPISALRSDDSASGNEYLQGLATFAERVYGGELFGEALTQMPPMAGEEIKSYTTDSLVTALATTLNKAIDETKTLPVWLPGTLTDADMTASQLVQRSPRQFKAGDRATAWIFIPRNAARLRVEWQGAPETLACDAAQQWKFAAPVSSSAKAAATLDVSSRPGWQRFTFAARAPLTIVAAQFEK